MFDFKVLSFIVHNVFSFFYFIFWFINVYNFDGFLSRNPLQNSNSEDLLFSSAWILLAITFMLLAHLWSSGAEYNSKFIFLHLSIYLVGSAPFTEEIILP